MNKLIESIDALSTEDLRRGTVSRGDLHRCIVCHETFEEGKIYTCGGDLRDAESAAAWHVRQVHGGMLTILLDLPSRISGLTDIQKTVLRGEADSVPDSEIGRTLGGRAESTIRNHRFQIRRRFTEARIQAALSELMRSGGREEEFVRFHVDLPVDDDRTKVTTSEESRILARLTEPGDLLRLVRFPKKQKEKLVLLRRIAAEFDPGRTYTEREVNEILEPVHHDYATIRRYLIDYRFMTRKPDGSEYRLTV